MHSLTERSPQPVLDFNRIPFPAGSLPVARHPPKGFQGPDPFHQPNPFQPFPSVPSGVSARGPVCLLFLFCDLPPATLDSSAPAAPHAARSKLCQVPTYSSIHARSIISLGFASPSLVTVTSLPTGTKKRGPRSIVNGNLNSVTYRRHAALASSTAPGLPLLHNQSRKGKETCRRGTCIFKVHRPYPAYHTQVEPPWAVATRRAIGRGSHNLPVPRSPVCYEVQRGRSPPRRTSHRIIYPLQLSFPSFLRPHPHSHRTLARPTRPDSLLRPSTSAPLNHTYPRQSY